MMDPLIDATRTVLVGIVCWFFLAPSVPSLLAQSRETTIRSVDFQNFVYDSGCADAPIVVKDGSYTRDTEDDRIFYEVSKTVVFGDLTGDGREEAVVRTLCNTGGTGQFTDGLVFTMRGSRPDLLATLGIGDRADGGIHDIAIENGQLVVWRYGEDHSGACCPEYVERTRLTWNGSEFVPTEPSVRYVYERDGAAIPAPKAVYFPRGASQTTVRGSTSDVVLYRLSARAGQRMVVTCTTEQEFGLVTISTSDGVLLASDYARIPLTVNLPSTGEYRIKVDAVDGEKMEFDLKISIR